MNSHSHGSARDRWTDRLNRFDQSGLTVAQFCKQERCSAASFYQWRRKLRDNPSRRSTRPTFVPVKITEAAADPSLLPQATVSLDLPGGVRLRIEVPANRSRSEKQEGTP